MVCNVGGKRMYLWRAVDDEGEVLDVVVQKRRDRDAGGLGNESEWSSRAKRMKARSLGLKPDGFPPEFFEGRRDYGDYFAHQARVQVG